MNDLVPAIVQNAITGQVLMLGYMNQESLQKTQDTGLVWFYSRSKQRLWQKGEESGNVLNVESIAVDCDNDSLRILVNPVGATCHTGEMSCFGNQSATMLDTLKQVIQQRKQSLNNTSLQPSASINNLSYTQQLLRAGMSAINAKIIEEAAEVTQALEKESDQRVIEESADVIYHLMVGLGERNINVQDVLFELNRRSALGTTNNSAHNATSNSTGKK